MSDTPITPVPLKKLVKSIIIDRGAYTLSGMGLLGLFLSPAAAVFLFREADQASAFLFGGFLLLVAAGCFYGGWCVRRLSQRLLDEFVASHDCPCDLCSFVKRTPNTSWVKRDTD